MTLSYEWATCVWMRGSTLGKFRWRAWILPNGQYAHCILGNLSVKKMLERKSVHGESEDTETRATIASSTENEEGRKEITAGGNLMQMKKTAAAPSAGANGVGPTKSSTYSKAWLNLATFFSTFPRTKAAPSSNTLPLFTSLVLFGNTVPTGGAVWLNTKLVSKSEFTNPNSAYTTLGNLHDLTLAAPSPCLQLVPEKKEIREHPSLRNPEKLGNVWGAVVPNSNRWQTEDIMVFTWDSPPCTYGNWTLKPHIPLVSVHINSRLKVQDGCLACRFLMDHYEFSFQISELRIFL